MSMVHASRGRSTPASPHLRSEVAIVAGSPSALARPTTRIDWAGIRARLRRDPRPHRARWCPASSDYNERVRAARRLRAAAPAARPPRRSRPRPARPASPSTRSRCCEVPAGPPAAADRAQPRPVQHHDLRPRRPLPRHHGGRRVVFVNPDDIAALGFADGEVRRPRQRVGATASRAAAPRRSGSSPTRRRGAAPRRTSRRPTCWCRSTRWPRCPTPRSRRASWCAWSTGTGAVRHHPFGDRLPRAAPDRADLGHGLPRPLRRDRGAGRRNVAAPAGPRRPVRRWPAGVHRQPRVGTAVLPRRAVQLRVLADDRVHGGHRRAAVRAKPPSSGDLDASG